MTACAASGEERQNGGSASSGQVPGTLVGSGEGLAGGDSGIPIGGGANSGLPGSQGLGPNADGLNTEADSCTQVDLLFVVDNSPSMGKYQESLAQAFPAFVDAMYERLPPGTSLHVGLTTTPFDQTGNCSEAVSNCVTTASEAEIRTHYTTPDLGDTGNNGDQGKLYKYQGLTWFDADTGDPDREPLKRWFAGAAVEAGERGCSFEMPSAAAGWALHPANASSNTGFLRDDDTVLLVFVLSDEPDKSPDAITSYVNMITAAKSTCGGASCVVPAGIVNGCIEGVNNPLWQFLHGFGSTPVIGDIDDQGNYAAVVGDALADVIETTCNEIILY